MLESVLGIELAGLGPVGETWELVDRIDRNSVVRGGPFDGRELRDLVATERGALLGATRPNGDGRFPVLIKYLSAAQPLSVQVHPDDSTARKLGGGDCGKTESWLILAAEPDSFVYLGLQDGVDPTEFAQAAGGPGIVDLMKPWPVEAGQFVHVPAGTLHAIGAGVTLVEVQQNSDLTYRLYDWGRVGLDGAPRETHAREGLLSIAYGERIEGPASPRLARDREGGDNRSVQLVTTDHYAIRLHEVGSYVELETDGRAQALVFLGGRARLWLDGAEEPWILGRGDTWLIPAVLGAYRIESSADTARFMVVTTAA